MSYDEDLAEVMRADLAALDGIDERRMFGGLCFMLRGHMLCGVHKDGAMYRVGKPRAAAALALAGTRPMDFTGRPMAGFVDVDRDAMEDAPTRHALLELAQANVATLPPR